MKFTRTLTSFCAAAMILSLCGCGEDNKTYEIRNR